MTSLMCNWFQDWGRAIKDGLGTVGIIIFLVAFLLVGGCLLYAIIRSLTITVKRKILWGYILLLVIIILFFIWFATLL